MPEQSYDRSNPLYYDQFFGMSEEVSPCEAQLQDDLYAEYISIYGGIIDIYLCSDYEPIPVFGEDPVKKYEIPAIPAKGMWDLTPEVLNMGQFGKNTDQEVIVIWMHKNTVKETIKNALLDAGMISEEDTIPDETGMSKYDRHRRELQEGDILRIRFNNIHYEIDGVKEEPEFQHHFYKYVYEVHARPRLVSGEDLGEMQPVTDSDAIRNDHETELQTEADKILF